MSEGAGVRGGCEGTVEAVQTWMGCAGSEGGGSRRILSRSGKDGGGGGGNFYQVRMSWGNSWLRITPSHDLLRITPTSLPPILTTDHGSRGRGWGGGGGGLTYQLRVGV